MRLNITAGFAVFFIALMFLMGESHEMVHTSVGRAICGDWGARDFNAWGLASGCRDANPKLATLATFAGPIYSFILVWIGFWLLRPNASLNSNAWGISLVGGNILFAKILTSTLASGDEIHGLRRLLDSFPVAWALGLAIVLALSIPPLRRVYFFLAPEKRKKTFAAFLILPFVVVLALGLSLNGILKSGFLDQDGIWGAPILVNAWGFLVLVLVVAFRKHTVDILGHADSQADAEKQSIQPTA